MNKLLNLAGLNYTITNNIKSHIEKKVEKLIDHEPKILRINIELIKELHSTSNRNQLIAKGHLNLKGPNIIASAESDNIFKSIDLMVDKLDRSLRRRSRLQTVKRKISIN